MHLLRMAGVAGIPLLVLSVLIVGLILRAASHHRRGKDTDLFTLLFWGFTAAVLGFLAQCAGLYRALTVISDAEKISAPVVMRGFAESFVTTLWGGGLLLVTGLAWGVLRILRRPPAHRVIEGTGGVS